LAFFIGLTTSMFAFIGRRPQVAPGSLTLKKYIYNRN
jgi:hypothetical protein